jgi:signal transduction histidine kinase
VDAAERVVVAADPDRIRQCIENVLSNAIRHSPHGADVNVFVRAQATGDGDWGVVEIHDQGPGIPAEILPRIFDKFVSGSKSSGLGLGLYLAKRIAVAHGGDLTADSTAGLGARFTLRLAGYREEPEADQG